MRIGVFTQPSTVDEMVDDVGAIHDAGFASAWTPQIFGVDALTALAVVAREVPDIEIGTAVVPVYPRHPMVLAAQALTVQQVSGGRLNLGVGLSHQVVIEGMLGIPWVHQARYAREYLSILAPLLRGEGVAFEGETLTMKGGLEIRDLAPVPVLLAALGPNMLAVAGELADGTATWMTGPTTIGNHVVPTIRAAASEAGRPDPRIVVALPTCVTDDVDGARAKAAKSFEIYGYLPSYRAMLDREGATGPADVAIVGDEAAVRAQIERIFELGATEFVAIAFSGRERTLAGIRELIG